MSNELPEPWAAELADKGVHSYRDFAAKVGSTHQTMWRLVNGKTSPSTVNLVADQLFGGDRDKVWELRGVPVRDHGDWSLPDGASLLSEAQREAIKAVVKAMLPDLASTPAAPAAESESDDQMSSEDAAWAGVTDAEGELQRPQRPTGDEVAG